MMIIAIDAHKRSHTAVRIDDNGRLLATKTVGTTTHDHLRLVKWAGEADGERRWAIEDCPHLTRRLERDLIAAGESVVRVPPKLMAHIRDSARTYENPIPSTPWRSPEPRYASRICRWPTSTVSNANCGC
jgi:transposase